MNRIDLANRVAVVTGGASGLGLGVARRFLESGATVVLWDAQGVALDAACRDLSAMVAWLASEECSFTTGFTFDLSGGRATY